MAASLQYNKENNEEEEEERKKIVFQYIEQNNKHALYRFCCQEKQRKTIDLEVVDDFGNTPLLKACILGKTKCALTLISFGANLRAINYLGQNALTQATFSGNKDLVQQLLHYRSYEDFNLSSIIPALCVAALKQHKHLIEYFKSIDPRRGTDIHTVHGLTPRDIEKALKICQPSKAVKN